MISTSADLLMNKQCLSIEQVRDPTPGHTRYSPLHTFAGLFVILFFFGSVLLLPGVSTALQHVKLRFFGKEKSWNSRSQAGAAVAADGLPAPPTPLSALVGVV